MKTLIALFKKLCMVVVILATLSCGGGNGITFPQGPTSGAGGLGSFLPVLTLEPQAAFDLVATFDNANQTFTFNYGGASSRACALHRLILVSAPNQADPGVTQVTQISLVQETKDFTIYAGTQTSTFIKNYPTALSALLLCVQNDSFTGTYVRSSLVDVTRYFPNR